MSIFNLDTFLPYQLATLSARASKGFARHYRERFGPSVSQWRVMAHLNQQDAVSVREICKRVDMDKPKVSRTAAKLERQGYVKKLVNKRDRRLVELSLTPKGRAMMDELGPIAIAYERELVAALGEDRDEFRRLIRKLDIALGGKGE